MTISSYQCCNAPSICFSISFLKSEDQEPFIKDKTGKAMPALLVFSESLGYLKQSLLNEVKNQLINIEMNEIKWVITVPAIWSDPAKAFMRRAAAKVFLLFCFRQFSNLSQVKFELTYNNQSITYITKKTHLVYFKDKFE